MKVSLFEQVPYRYIPEGFETQHNSAVTPPYDIVEPGRMTESLFSAYTELLHGARAGFDAIGSGLAWNPFLDLLATRHTVYAPEHPGTSPGDPQVEVIDDCGHVLQADQPERA